MKDEELAKEYEENAEYIEIDDYGHKVYGSQDIEQAFLAGLKAGRPKWHKVADGDLPEYKGAVLSDKGEFVYYNSFSKCLVDETYTKQTDIIAWCEIPKYTEE